MPPLNFSFPCFSIGTYNLWLPNSYPWRERASSFIISTDQGVVLLKNHLWRQKDRSYKDRSCCLIPLVDSGCPLKETCWSPLSDVYQRNRNSEDALWNSGRLLVQQIYGVSLGEGVSMEGSRAYTVVPVPAQESFLSCKKVLTKRLNRR